MEIKYQRAADVAAVEAVKAKLLSDTTLLGVVGTLAAADVTLEHFGKAVGESANLSGCNIGTVTLTDCFSDPTDAGAYASTLDLSHNRMDAAALETLLTELYMQIVMGTSSAVLTLDISDNVVPNAATMQRINDICTQMVTGSVTCDAPVTVTATGVTDPTTAGVYTYSATSGSWVNAGGDYITYNGTNYILMDAGLLHTWTGPADTIYGTYTLAAHDSIVVS